MERGEEEEMTQRELERMKQGKSIDKEEKGKGNVTEKQQNIREIIV